jgi:hypothetical protein
MLVITLWLGWPLASPLFTNTTVEEAFPFAVNATVPPYMGIQDVETIMAGMAKVESPVDEQMPDMDAQAPPAQETPTPETTVSEPTIAAAAAGCQHPLISPLRKCPTFAGCQHRTNTTR